ncbi:MAG: magnesium transporter [Candidatus Nanoarchaeia archaeon]
MPKTPDKLIPPFLALHRHHWKARAMLQKDFKEIFIAEMISISGSLIAGTLLAIYIKQILLIPGLLILLPGFLEMRGNISGALAARFGTALDTKQIPARIKNNEFVRQNILATFAEALLIALSLAAVAFFVTYFIFGVATLNIFLIALIAAIISNLIEAALTTYTTFLLFRKGYDPNNIMGPYITTTGDIISIFSLLFAIIVVSWL